MITTASTARTCIHCGTLRSLSNFCRHFMAAAKAMRHQLQDSTPATRSTKRSAITDGLRTLLTAGCSTDLASSSRPPTRQRGTIRTGTRCGTRLYFQQKAVHVVGLIVLPDAELQAGTARFYSFDQALETIPNGEAAPPEVRTQTPCRTVDMWKGP